MRFILGILCTLTALLLVAVITIYSGWYNVAATEPHLGIANWALHTTMHHSVERRASEIAVPPLTEAMAAEGLPHFQEMCVTCHGAPGVERGEAGQGLVPMPPDLTHSAEHLKPNELFWITKHGIRMTGMPAWGRTHSDEAIWSMVAFLKALPGMSPEQYAAQVKGLSGGESALGESAGHGHGGEHNAPTPPRPPLTGTSTNIEAGPSRRSWRRVLGALVGRERRRAITSSRNNSSIPHSRVVLEWRGFCERSLNLVRR